MSRRQGGGAGGRNRGNRRTGERRKARPPTNRHYPRTARLNALLQQIVADHLGRADDERLGFLTVTGVEVDAELTKAHVFLSTLDTDSSADAALLAVLAEEYRKPIQADIARSARLRKTPEVVFALDPAVRSGARIEEILSTLELNDDGDASTGDGDEDPDGRGRLAGPDDGDDAGSGEQDERWVADTDSGTEADE